MADRAEDTVETRAAKSAGAKAAATVRKKAKRSAQAAKKVRARETEGFMNFIRSQGVVGLAVGLVLGTQVKTLVDQLLASFVNPLLGLVLPGDGDLVHKQFVLDALGKRAVFQWGQFAYVLISFIIVAAIIYYIVKGLKLDKLDQKKE